MLKRRMVFYRWSSQDSDKVFDPHDVVRDLYARLQADEEAGILDSGDSTVAVIPIEFADKTRPVRLQLLSLRSAGRLPAKWRPDAPLDSIPLLEGEYSADVTHVCIWADGIAGQEYHANAPRLNRLSFFLRRKLGVRTQFDPLYNPDMFDRLERLRGRLRSVHITLVNPHYAHSTDRSGAFGELIPAVFGSRAPSLNVQLGMGRYGPRDRFLDAGIEDAVFDIAEHAHEQVDRMVVGGINPATGKSERVDLLNERVQIERALPEDSRVNSIPESSVAFDAIEEARTELDGSALIERSLQAQAVHK
ncbi:hypothetical protein [Amycolatopsis sp. CFH S0078]|uniref:hypothetical protein n=1 Tax=Amycolatopsis sp. CFH S0078 TaxID=1644108 RepID=UPI00106E97E0|nr:hypothetical protein [Amycolatopsis sp. CFH S0078]